MPISLFSLRPDDAGFRSTHLFSTVAAFFKINMRCKLYIGQQMMTEFCSNAYVTLSIHFSYLDSLVASSE